MYYLQSRYYDPAIGRFINADTFATTDADGFLSCNMFAYCENDPVNKSDQSGTIALTTAVTLINVGIGAITGGIAGYLNAKHNGSNPFVGAITGALNGGICGAVKANPVGVIICFAVGFTLDLSNQLINNAIEGKKLTSFDYGSAMISGVFSAFAIGKQARINSLIPAKENLFSNAIVSAIGANGTALLATGVSTYYKSISKHNSPWNQKNNETLQGKNRFRGYTM